MKTLQMKQLDGEFAIARLSPSDPIPEWVAGAKGFTSVTRTDYELSILCSAESLPDEVKCEKGFAGLRVAGKLDFSATGVLASLAGPLAKSGISILAVSTFDTDYLFVQRREIDSAIRVLRAAGHAFQE